MKAVSGKEFAKLLEKRGWICQRVNGSHHIYTNAGNTVRISLPIHGNQSLKIRLLRHFMKLAGIDESELQAPVGEANTVYHSSIRRRNHKHLVFGKCDRSTLGPDAATARRCPAKAVVAAAFELAWATMG